MEDRRGPSTAPILRPDDILSICAEMASHMDFMRMHRDLSVGFIGYGDLGKAILKGITHKPASSPHASNWWAGRRYLASVQSEKSAQALRETYPDETTLGTISLAAVHRQNVLVAKKSDVIILACPPGAIESVLKEEGMADALSQKLLISLAAGVTISQMQAALYENGKQAEGEYWIVRALPNIAASVAASATAITLATDPPPPSDMVEIVDSLFQCVGGITHIPESQMDSASVVCGATPAFMSLFCDAIIDGAVAGGLPRAQAEAMTAQAMASTAALLAVDGGGKRPSEVRENVCANPGITIGGILDLEKGNVRGSISGAVRDSILAARSVAKKDG